MRTQIAEGLRYLFRHRLLRTVAVLLGVTNFATKMGQATLVLLAVEILHTGTGGYGLLWTASAAGAILGGMTAAALTGRLGMLPSLILSLAASAVAFAGIGLAPDEVVACALFASNGYASTMWNVVTVSLRQQIVPGELFGRVNSVYRMIGWGLLPVGAITGGFVADAFGLRAPYLLGGITIGIAAAAALPALAHAGRASQHQAGDDQQPARRDEQPTACRSDGGGVGRPRQARSPDGERLLPGSLAAEITERPGGLGLARSGVTCGLRRVVRRTGTGSVIIEVLYVL